MSRTTVLAFAAASVLTACAQHPKPAALSAFEALKRQSQTQGALAGLEGPHRHLLADSQKAEALAVEAWQDGDLDEAKHQVALARAYWRQALARAELARTRRALREVQRQNGSLAAQNTETRRHLSRVNELIALHEELAMARINTREKAMHLSEVQRKATARYRITAARLALKVAETVEAQRLAKGLHQASAQLIDQAQKLLTAKKPTKAAALATAAQRKAEEAHAKAKPLFLRDKRAAKQRAKDLALQRAIAAWAAKHRGVTVRVGVAASGSQLELRIMSLFAVNKTAPRRGKRPALNKLGKILKAYPGYPVLIRGFTSFATARRRRAGISRARANAVRERLLAQQLKASRFVAEGAGASKLIAAKASNLNDRVELIIPLVADTLTSKSTSKPTLVEDRPLKKVP